MNNSISDTAVTKSELLEEVSARLAEINIKAQLDTAIETLGFLKDIVRPTKKNKQDREVLEKGIEVLTSEEFREKIKAVFFVNYNQLDSADLARYLGDLRYEERVARVATTLIPELTQVNIEYFGN